MKKLLTVLICILLCVPAFAQENTVPSLPAGEIVKITPGEVIDLDGDGSADEIKYGTKYNEDMGYEAFRLVIGPGQLDGEGDDLTGDIWAYKPEGFDDVIILLPDYGMSDDDWCHAYSYYKGAFRNLGGIGCMPEELSVTEPNLLTGKCRGYVLHTWYRPADYLISGSYDMTDYAYHADAICEMPRSEYPMGATVTLLHDITLQISRTNPAYACEIKAGEKAVIAATDDIEWLYIVPLDPSHAYMQPAGWLRTEYGGYSAIIDGEEIETWNLFDGLFYAD